MVMDLALKTSLKEWKESGKKIVFTNGCFDILHIGHLRMLKQAKGLGDILVVGLNSDLSVRRLKGETRPIINQKERKEILEALRFVDAVTIFEEDTPYELISEVEPNVLAKGGDWPVERIIGFDLVSARGGQVYSLPYVPQHSTSDIIKKICSL